VAVGPGLESAWMSSVTAIAVASAEERFGISQSWGKTLLCVR